MLFSELIFFIEEGRWVCFLELEGVGEVRVDDQDVSGIERDASVLVAERLRRVERGVAEDGDEMVLSRIEVWRQGGMHGRADEALEGQTQGFLGGGDEMDGLARK